jgi:hypothetical protein
VTGRPRPGRAGGGDRAPGPVRRPGANAARDISLGRCSHARLGGPDDAGGAGGGGGDSGDGTASLPFFFLHAPAWACRRALVRSHFAPRPTGSGGRRPASRGILATGGSSVRVARYVTHGGTRPPRTLRLRCSGQANK